jgi:hypothetical protein
MEPEGSLPPSQVTATCLCPEPAQSSPFPNIPLPDDPSYLNHNHDEKFTQQL